MQNKLLLLSVNENFSKNYFPVYLGLFFRNLLRYYQINIFQMTLVQILNFQIYRTGALLDRYQTDYHIERIRQHENTVIDLNGDTFRYKATCDVKTHARSEVEVNILLFIVI